MPTPGWARRYVRARAIAEQLNLPDYLLPVLYGQWLFHNNRAEIVLARSIAETAGESRPAIA